MSSSLYEALSKQYWARQEYFANGGEHIPTKLEELQAQINCMWDFLQVIEKEYPEEFEDAYNKYKLRGR